MGILAENRMQYWEQGTSDSEHARRAYRYALVSSAVMEVSRLFGRIGDNARASKHMCTIRMSSGSRRLFAPTICVVSPNPVMWYTCMIVRVIEYMYI